LIAALAGAASAAIAAAAPLDDAACINPVPPAEDVARIACDADAPKLPNPLDVFSLLDADFHVGPWKFRGYVQADVAEYLQPAAGPLESDFRRGAVDDGDSARARQLTDGALLRRARFGGEGTWGPDIAYRAMFELGANGERGNPRIAEVWVTWRPVKPYSITLGAFSQLANMEEATSADSLLFLERATAADLARGLGAGDGRIGVMLRRADPRWLVAVSLTGPVIDHAETDSPRAAVVARVSRTFDYGAGVNLHLGGSAIYVLQPAKKAPDRPGFPVRLSATPEVDVDSMPLIDTGQIAAAHASVLGVEFAAQRRSLYVQAEAFRFGVDRRDLEGPNSQFFGWYAEGSWILTGERRRFDPSRGVFWFPEPARPFGQGGWGAWELALRYSRMNLDAHPGEAGAPPPPGGIRGGDQRILSAGVEWYPRARIRLMLNYLRVSVDRLNPASAQDPEPFGPIPATPPLGVQIGQRLNIFAIRARFSF
jgi:phosphate-selective porin OprO/OprP